ncbi:hypothetical protein COU74_00185 [Candidatus Peregrinibacteria bacterium CG10_big_fil_rev_8_21_14_0_10_36_19]|nr:MAG: hypothetical protein COU74_00185 [Candidatus Peregrinibacteria bacterium CG10_big_fil_rev_8_21_14_0_10_36_19]
MGKKITDVKTGEISKIDLKRKSKSKTGDLILDNKKRASFKKDSHSIHEFTDLQGAKKGNYTYIKGKKFTPPKFLDSLIKMGSLGLLILVLINGANVYFKSKSLERELSKTAYEGVGYLIDAGKSATKIQFDQALTAFEKASTNFESVQDQLWFISQDKSIYNADNTIGQAANGLLEGGKHFSVAGKYFLEALDEFNKIPLYFFSKNNSENSDNTKSTPSITDTLKNGLQKTQLAIDEIDQASELINKIKEKDLPDDLKSRVIFAKQKVSEVSNILNSTAKYFPAILDLLGDRYPHRYLILLQNNNEIRPTGGFIGSYGIMDINDGYIENLEIHDVYDIDGSYGGIIEPPEELKTFTSNWRFRDSNYSPDFPTSAKKARWFLEKQGGPSVDTVIAINQGLLRDLMEITGPVQVGNFGKLTSSNYNLLLSYVIEGKIWGPENPKHILKVFIPAFKEAIMKESNVGRVTSKLYKAVQQKHIMVYSSHDDIEDLITSMGLSGEVKKTAENEDYLSVINIAYGGTKSEQFMKEEIYHDTYIDKVGNVTNEVRISRQHQWSPQIYRQWKQILKTYGFEEMPDQLIDTLGRGPNKVGVRVYVPEGSTLIESNVKDIKIKFDKDTKKTYFYFKSETSAGEKKEAWIKYRPNISLKFNPTSAYRLTIEKQPGTAGSIFTKTLHVEDGLKTLMTYPSDSQTYEDSSALYAKDLVYDRYFSALIRK